MWSKKTYRLREIVENPGNHLLYYLKDGPPQTVEKGASTIGAPPGSERAFVSEELMLIPEDTV